MNKMAWLLQEHNPHSGFTHENTILPWISFETGTLLTSAETREVT